MITIITPVCPICGKTHNIQVYSSDYVRFMRREGLVQDCFPYLKAEEREMLISGICPDCWTKMFAQ